MTPVRWARRAMAAEGRQEAVGHHVVGVCIAEPAGDVAVDSCRVPVVQQREGIGIVQGPADHCSVVLGVGRGHECSVCVGRIAVHSLSPASRKQVHASQALALRTARGQDSAIEMGNRETAILF